MKARNLIFAGLFLCAAAGFAQTIDSSIHVNQFPGSTVAAKLTNAMATCSTNTQVPCVLVLDPSLAPMTNGTLPSMCAHCYLVDWRSGPPFTASGAVNAVVGSGAPNSALCLTTGAIGNFYLDYPAGEIWNCESDLTWHDAGALPQVSTGLIEVKAWGAVCDGSHVDTTALANAFASVPMIGGAIHIPGRCLTATTLAFPAGVPGTIFGDGTCNNDLTDCISELILSGSDQDAIAATGQYFSVRNLAVVSAPGLAGTPQTAGALIDYCDPDAAYDDKIDVENVQTEGGFDGVRDCNSEAGTISLSLIGDNYHDGIVLGTGTVSNLGDTQISGNTLTGAGEAANVAIDDQGAGGGFVSNNLIDQGITPQEASFDTAIYTAAGGGFYSVNNNHAEHYNDYCMFLLAGVGSIVGNSCDRPSGASLLPDVVSAASIGETFAANQFQNGTGDDIPEAILFTGDFGDNQNTVVSESNTARGYDTVQTGLILCCGLGNYDGAYRGLPTQVTATGCSVSGLSGNAHSGTFTVGAVGCNVLITFPEGVGESGWECSAHDVMPVAVSVGVVIGEISNSGSAVYLNIPSSASVSDQIDFSCDPI